MERHNFEKSFKLQACAGDDYRPIMNYIHIIGPYAYASDSHVLVKANLHNISTFNEEEILAMNGMSIEAKMFRSILRHNVVSVEGDSIIAHEKGYDITYRLAKTEELGKLPDFEKVLNVPIIEDHAVDAVGLNAKYLGNISAALGSQRLALTFNGTSRGIKVKPYEPIDACGLIMPIYIGD